MFLDCIERDPGSLSLFVRVGVCFYVKCNVCFQLFVGQSILLLCKLYEDKFGIITEHGMGYILFFRCTKI